MGEEQPITIRIEYYKVLLVLFQLLLIGAMWGLSALMLAALAGVSLVFLKAAFIWVEYSDAFKTTTISFDNSAILIKNHKAKRVEKRKGHIRASNIQSRKGRLEIEGETVDVSRLEAYDDDIVIRTRKSGVSDDKI